MVVPNRRTMVVLVVLVGAMTLATGMLMGLEPGPSKPINFTPLMDTSSSMIDPVLESLLSTTPRPVPGRWTAIAIHFSGQATGSAQSLNQLHRRHGFEGLGYHMVIGNGTESPDGQIEFGYRWMQQIDGLKWNRNGNGAQLPVGQIIDICLIGDSSRRPPTRDQMNQLAWLVFTLQSRFNIPAQRVYFYMDSATGQGRMFPLLQFRQQLLDYPRP